MLGSTAEGDTSIGNGLAIVGDLFREKIDKKLRRLDVARKQ